jgi:hypothetical protein
MKRLLKKKRTTTTNPQHLVVLVPIELHFTIEILETSQNKTKQSHLQLKFDNGNFKTFLGSYATLPFLVMLFCLQYMSTCINK